MLASYTADGTVGEDGAASRCGRDLDLKPDDAGTVSVDLTKPRSPSTVIFLPVAEGSHNMTIHPSGDYLYNSNADLITAPPRAGRRSCRTSSTRRSTCRTRRFGYGNDLVRGFDVYRFNGKPVGEVPVLKPRNLKSGTVSSADRDVAWEGGPRSWSPPSCSQPPCGAAPGPFTPRDLRGRGTISSP